jgi:hypothetical protein
MGPLVREEKEEEERASERAHLGQKGKGKTHNEKKERGSNDGAWYWTDLVVKYGREMMMVQNQKEIVESVRARTADTVRIRGRARPNLVR